MTTFTIAINIPQSTPMISGISQSYDDERNSAALLPNDHHHNLDNLPLSSKHTAFIDDDDSQNDEEYDNEYSQFHLYKAIAPEIFNKRYVNKVIRGGNPNGNSGDSRLWAIPYRFGKRAAMPYRFGKRAGMHFRLGKKSASL